MSYPDQVHPDIVVWRDLVADPPSSIKPFFPRRVKVLTAAKKDLPAKIPPAPKPEILQGDIFPLLPMPLTLANLFHHQLHHQFSGPLLHQS